MFPYGYKAEEPRDVIDHASDAEHIVGDQHPDVDSSRFDVPQRQSSYESYENYEKQFGTGTASGSKRTLVGDENDREVVKDKSDIQANKELSGDDSESQQDEEQIYETAPSTPYVAPEGLMGDEEKAPEVTRVVSRKSALSNASTNRSGLTVRPVPSLDREGNYYPEGGMEAYSVVFGAFFAMFGSLGVVNSTGIFQAYLLQNQLSDHSEGEVGWIFGVYAFLMFFSSLQIGPIFDAKGPRELLYAGTILTVVGLLVLSWCTKYSHFMVVLGLMIGLGNSLVFNPSVASISHYFLRYRARATGVATSGGGVGGVVFPLMLQALFPKIGWAWAMRAMALLCLVTLGIGCLLIKSRLPTKKATKENLLPDFRIFKQKIFTVVSIGVFFLEWGMFIPVTYISSYALDRGVSERLSYQILALLNVGSAFGRFLPGFVADYIGRFNTMILTAVLCFLTNFVLWFPAASNTAMIIIFAIAFGFASGSNISLVAVCIGQVCKTESYGRYYATAYTLVSFAVLTGVPIAGSIISQCDGSYWGLILFTGLSYVAATIAFTVAKLMYCGWTKPWAVW